jgi:hypothetical protein
MGCQIILSLNIDLGRIGGYGMWGARLVSERHLDGGTVVIDAFLLSGVEWRVELGMTTALWIAGDV